MMFSIQAIAILLWPCKFVLSFALSFIGRYLLYNRVEVPLLQNFNLHVYFYSVYTFSVAQETQQFSSYSAHQLYTISS